MYHPNILNLVHNTARDMMFVSVCMEILNTSDKIICFPDIICFSILLM
jgi:hypothetical protein